MGKNLINDTIRQKLRRLRKSRKLTIKRVAEQAGIPVSSYGCMEHGFYNISLEHLYNILGVLDADIGEVWPVHGETAGTVDETAYCHRIQQFRLQEVVSLTGAEGGALFCVSGGKCKVLVYQNLSDFLLDRLHLYLEDGMRYQKGIWFEKKVRGDSLYFFLKAESCPGHIAKLIKDYMSIWAAFYLCS